MRSYQIHNKDIYRYELTGISQAWMNYGSMACTFIAHQVLHDLASFDFASGKALNSNHGYAEKFKDSIKTGVQQHQRYCVNKGMFVRFQYKQLSVAAANCQNLEKLTKVAKGSQIVNVYHSDDATRSAVCTSGTLETVFAKNEGDKLEFTTTSDYPIQTSKHCYDEDQSKFDKLNASNIGYIFGGKKHAIAVIQSGKHFFLFNSKTDDYMGSAYVLAFTGKAAQTDLIGYIKEALWPRKDRFCGLYQEPDFGISVAIYALVKKGYGTI